LKDLHMKLQRLHGKAFGTYNDLRGHAWEIGDFQWNWIHIQGDPFAPPSRLRISASLAALGIPESWFSNPIRTQALADFLLRRLALCLGEHSQNLGTGNGGVLACAEPGPQVLRRNSMRIENGTLTALVQVGLPSDERRVVGEWVIQLLCQSLPDALTEALYSINIRAKECEAHIHALELQQALRATLPQLGLVAFVADGSVLPRASGSSNLPLRGARPFVSPLELRTEIEVLGEKIVGMGIPTGITAIAGGGFQGKSTLLRSLELAIYDHIPGDGRERVVCDPSAFKVRTEEGRQVIGSCIEPLVRRLPGGKETNRFTTTSASGSTSQAANLVEAIGLGAQTILIDEDISAVNFLIRDERMRQLVRSSHEPLIPLVDRIVELKTQLKLNFVMVIGACGDYLRVADTVIVMEDWEPRVATLEAHEICAQEQASPAENWPKWPKDFRHSLEDVRKKLRPGLRPATAVEKGIKVKVTPQKVQLGRLIADISRVPQIVCSEQLRSIGAAALALLQSDPALTLEEAVSKGSLHLSMTEGLDLAEARPLELGATLLRMAEME